MGKETESNCRVALFGGTFNPIHIAHLRAAEEVAEQFRISKVFFIPSCHPPHKPPDFLAPASQRLEMTELAVGTNPRFAVSDIEIKRKGYSYTIDTVKHFRSLHGSAAELYFITGTDAFQEIHTWRNYDELFSLCHFIVVSRPGHAQCSPEALIPGEIAGRFCPSKAEGDAVLVHSSGKKVLFVSITLMDVSSSLVRNKFQKGLSAKYLMPDSVETYIIENSIYFK